MRYTAGMDDRFDIDVAVESVSDPETWSRMERDLEARVGFPLDLIPLDRIRAEFCRCILARGRILSDRQQRHDPTN